MTDEEEFRNDLTSTLEQLSDFGNAIQKKCNALIQQNKSNTESDINGIEDVALNLIKMLKKTKGNIFAVLSFLERDIKQLNVTRQKASFEDIVKQICECRTCTVVMEDGTAVFSQPVDKEVMVDLDATATECTFQNVDLHSHDEDSDGVKFVCESLLPETKTFNLSLRKKIGRCDTEDTNDLWEDTLGRNGVKNEIRSEIASSTMSCLSSHSLELKEEQLTEESDKADDMEDKKLVESGHDCSLEDKIMESEDDVEGSKTVHADGGTPNDNGEDSESIWSTETVLADLEGLDRIDEYDDGGSMELAPTQTVWTNAAAETIEDPDDVGILKPTETNDVHEVDPESVEAEIRHSTDTLILERAHSSTNDASENLLSGYLPSDDSPVASNDQGKHIATVVPKPTEANYEDGRVPENANTIILSLEQCPAVTEEQGIRCNEKDVSRSQVIEKEDDIPDEQLCSTGFERNNVTTEPQNQSEDDRLNVNLAPSMADAGNEEVALGAQINGSTSDIGRRDDINVVCEDHDNIDDYMENGETTVTKKGRSQADDIEIDDTKSPEHEINDIVTIGDDSSGNFESQKKQHAKYIEETEVEQAIARSPSITGTPSDSHTKNSERRLEDISDVDLERPVMVRDTSEKDINASFENIQVEQDHLEGSVSVQETGIDKDNVIPDNNSESNAKSREEAAGLDVPEDGCMSLKDSRDDDCIENIDELREQECTASEATDGKKDKSSSCMDICDSGAVVHDFEDGLCEANIDGGNIVKAGDENKPQQAGIYHTDLNEDEKEDMAGVDLDATQIEGNQGTAESQNIQNPTVTVQHMTENNQTLSKISEKNVQDSRPDSRLSDCNSFMFDVQSCSQTGSLDEKGCGSAENILKEDNLTGVSKDILDKKSSRCDIQDDAVSVLSEIESSSDYENEGSRLVDVVMEEILESRGKSDKALELEEKVSVKVEPNIEEAEEKVTDVSKLGDELLELFREVKMSKDLDEHAYAKNPDQIEGDSDNLSEYESDEAEAIFKALVEDSTDTSDSDSIDDGEMSAILNEFDIDVQDDKSQDSESKKSGDDELLKLRLMMALQLKEKKMERCYVRLERVDLEKLSNTWRTTSDVDDSIDRLCDLSTLNKKASGQSRPGHRKKRKKSGRSSNLSKDLFDSSNSSSDVEVWSGRSASPELSSDVEKRLDRMLATVAMEGMAEKDTSDTDSEHADEEVERKTKKKMKNDREAEEITAQIKLTKEEKDKKKWRNDKLLREKLGSSDSSDSGSSNDSSGCSRKKRRLKKKYEDEDPDYRLDFDEHSSGDGVRRRITTLKEEHSDTSDDSESSDEDKVKLEDTSDNDTDVEFVFKDVASSPELTPTQKGHRRNIRALMSDADLEEATLKAKEVEAERIGRLKNKQKLRDSVSQSLSQSGETEEEEKAATATPVPAETLEEGGLVLDVDEDTNRPLVQVDPELTKILKSHQKAGIQFMWDCCYESLERIKAKDPGSGCILAHCMGLGKTLQVLALIHTLFAYKETEAKHVLVVCPLSTVSNWKKEVRLRLKDVKKNFEVFTIGSTQDIVRQQPIIKQWYCATRSVLIMGYERYECLINEDKLNKFGAEFKTLVLNALVDPGPDLIVCDEGHLLKSKKAVKVQALNQVCTKRRIVLTGTPLQNNLIEYYHMVQFVKPNLLGNLKEFKTNFVNPITNGQYEDSTKEDIKLMKKRTHVLHNYLKQTIQRFEDTELQTYLKKMHHYAVFVQLHPVQVEFYKQFLDISVTAQRDEERQTGNHKGFLSDYAMFQYICTHPQLLKIMDDKRNNNDREQDVIITDDVRPTCNMGKWWKNSMPPDAENTIEYGTKLLVVKHILEECEEIGDKVLIFSQSLGELDLIEHFLKNCGTSKCPSWQKDVDYTRMDGTIKPECRSGICDRFNEKSNEKLRLLLISLRVGGLGLNLTAANRVITMTVCWNPSYDLQSVFRVYRFGQEKNVYIYRLIALDTMEEKAYQRTVTKLAVAHRVIDKYQIQRHYKSVDLQAMYSCLPTVNKQRPTPNVPDDEVLAKLILKLPLIYKYHEQQALLANRPEDDLNEQEKIAAWEEFEKEKNVQKAAKEAAAIAASFAEESAVASAAAMAAFKNLTNLGGGPLVSGRSRGPTFNTAYALCPPGDAGGTASSINDPNIADSTSNGDGVNSNRQVGNGGASPSVTFSGESVDLTRNDGTNNVGNAKTTQGDMNNVPQVDERFNKALEQLIQLNARHFKKAAHINPTKALQRRLSEAAQLRLIQQNEQLSRSIHAQHVDETAIDLTRDKQHQQQWRAVHEDPVATASNTKGSEAAPPLIAWSEKSVQWVDKQKTNLFERQKHQNQKENNQQLVRPKGTFTMKPLKTYRKNTAADAASKAAQMDHAYSATSQNAVATAGVKRKSVSQVDPTTATVLKKKKRRNNSNNNVLRVNPCALLPQARLPTVAAASKTATTSGAAPVVNLSDDDVEVVVSHQDIISSLFRSGVTVRQLTNSTNRKTYNDVITLD